MADDDIPELPKKEWYDGKERVCAGTILEFNKNSQHYGRPLRVHETPTEVNKLMSKHKPKDMIELHHFLDPSSSVFVRNKHIVSLDVCWELLEED